MHKPALKLLAVICWLLTLPLAQAETVWIDVRTVEEYDEDHIDGDANIPLAELDPQKLATLYPDATEFMLYCRSGNRAGQAKELLDAAGFINVVNAGGIGDARKLREQAQTASTAASQAVGAVAAPPR